MLVVKMVETGEQLLAALESKDLQAIQETVKSFSQLKIPRYKKRTLVLIAPYSAQILLPLSHSISPKTLNTSSSR